jgi:vacuolar-type H+-ATPase subunit H
MKRIQLKRPATFSGLPSIDGGRLPLGIGVHDNVPDEIADNWLFQQLEKDGNAILLGELTTEKAPIAEMSEEDKAVLAEAVEIVGSRDALLQAAKEEAEKNVGDAIAAAEKIIGDAKAEAQKLVADAQTKAGEIVAAAKAEAKKGTK